MTAKRYSNYWELFDPMANFAIKNGMTSYHGDLMHDALKIYDMTSKFDCWNAVLAVRSNGCGTDFYGALEFGMLEENGTFDPNRPKATVKYDGQFFYFITED